METVASVQSAMEGGEIRWLAPGEAAEFEVANVPDNLWSIWAGLQDRGLDMAVQNASGRRKRLLLADMDSTLIQQECVDELAAEAGVGSQVADITARAMNGELDFSDALRARVALLQGLDASVIDAVLRNRITLMPGGPVLCATMKAAGAHLALVSGGFTAFTKAIAARLGFDEHHANTIQVGHGKLTGRVTEPILGRDAKVAQLRKISARLNITADDVISVGDGANDLGMLDLAGTGVAMHAKPAVAAKCDVRINFGDLTALLYLQGYSREDFVTSA